MTTGARFQIKHFNRSRSFFDVALIMSSKKQGGIVTVHNSELYSELLGGRLTKEDQEEEEEVPISSPVVSPRGPYGISPTRVPSRSSTAQMTRIEDWLSRKARRAVVSLPDDPELVALKELCQTISDQEEQFLGELDTFLATEEERVQCKKEILYSKWCERVFHPIQSKLAQQMTGGGYQALSTEKRALFNHYLSYRNRQNVFLDTISAEEYDPMKLDHSLKACTGVLDDPLISQRTDHTSEQEILRGCNQGIPLSEASPTACNGREDTDPVLWLAMQLVHIDSKAREKSKNRMTHDHNRESGEGSKRELDIPHKRPVTYQRTPFELTWQEQIPTSS